jgi:hypothetical protein
MIYELCVFHELFLVKYDLTECSGSVGGQLYASFILIPFLSCHLTTWRM